MPAAGDWRDIWVAPRRTHSAVRPRSEVEPRGGAVAWHRLASVSFGRQRVRQTATRYAERFVRSVKEECLNRIVPLGERHLRRTLHEFATHYHRERNHQGLAKRADRDVLPRNDRPVPFAAASESVGFSATTTGQPRRGDVQFERGTERALKGTGQPLGKVRRASVFTLARVRLWWRDRVRMEVIRR